MDATSTSSNIAQRIAEYCASPTDFMEFWLEITPEGPHDRVRHNYDWYLEQCRYHAEDVSR